MTFNRWLSQQRDRNDPIGDLANDWIGDRQRKPGNNPIMIYCYLRRQGAYGAAIEAFENAWEEYSGRKFEDVLEEDMLEEASNDRRLVTPSARFEILKRDGYRCQICGRDPGDGIKLHIDHKVPVSRGGLSEKSNLWTLCNECNFGKGNKSL